MTAVTVVTSGVIPMTLPSAADPRVQAGITTAVPTSGPWIPKKSPDATVHAALSGTGAVTATVTVEVTNDPDSGPLATVAGTITLSGTNLVGDGFTTQGAPWKFIRITVTAISGTGATVKAWLGV